MYCLAGLTAQDEDLARRVYAYFIFRLRQPDEAERLTRLSFERVWEEAKLSREVEQEPDLPTVRRGPRRDHRQPPRPRSVEDWCV